MIKYLLEIHSAQVAEKIIHRVFSLLIQLLTSNKKEILKQGKSYSLLVNLARCCLIEKDYTRASDIGREALNFDSKSAEAYTILGTSSFLSGQPEAETITLFEKSLIIERI